MRKPKWLLQFFVSCVFLCFLACVIRPKQIKMAVSRCNGYILLVAILLLPIVFLIRTCRWAWIINRKERSLPFRDLFFLTLIGVTLGFVTKYPPLTQLGVLAVTGTVFTAGIYGAVAAMASSERASSPRFIKALSGIGIAAMLTVGGGLLTHHTPGLAPVFHDITHSLDLMPHTGGIGRYLLPLLGDALGGLIAGGALLAGAKVTAPAAARVKKWVIVKFSSGKAVDSTLSKPALSPAFKHELPIAAPAIKAPSPFSEVSKPSDAWPVAAAGDSKIIDVDETEDPSAGKPPPHKTNQAPPSP